MIAISSTLKRACIELYETFQRETIQKLALLTFEKKKLTLVGFQP